MKIIAIVLTVGLTALLLQTAKAAAPETKQRKFCRNYASTAKEAADRNRGQRCYFKGSRWGTDPNRHFAWCMTGPAKLALSKETFARRQGLDECRERRRLCRTYATYAISAIEKAFRRDLPKQPGAALLGKRDKKRLCRDKTTSIVGKQMYSIWKRQSRIRHEDWCMAVGLKKANQIEALRSHRLGSC